MEIFDRIITTLAGVPDWVALIVLPALLVPAALTCALVDKRKLYALLSLLLGAAGFTLLACGEELKAAFVYAGLFVALALLFSLLLLIPSPLPKARAARGTKQDRIYEKFRLELTEKPYTERENLPPKECCFESEPLPAAECGFHLEHVTALLKKLRACPKLTASDRLETDVLERRLTIFGGKALGEEDRRALNDLLASVLKLTAKYQL